MRHAPQICEDVYLVDTDVLSAGAPTKAQHPQDLIAWMDRNSDRLYLSAMSVAEVEEGIAKARRRGAAVKADRLVEWLETLLHLYGSRILPLDVVVARRLGKLSDISRGAGHAPGVADLVIAATATARDLTVLTRNLRHFRALPVRVHDPFLGLPAE